MVLSSWFVFLYFNLEKFEMLRATELFGILR